MGRLIDLDKVEFLKVDGNIEFNHGVDCCINRLLKQPTVEAIPKDQYEARLRTDKMATFKEFRDKLSKWMFYNSESVCGNSMIDIDYLEGHMDELLYELEIYEVEDGNDD